MDDNKSNRCLLRWHEYSSSVASAVQTIRFDEELFDVTLACEGHTIRAHKLVLAASSHYFRTIFKVRFWSNALAIHPYNLKYLWQEFPCEHPTIVIDNIKRESLLSILHFMYYGQVLVEEDQISSLLSSAASLSVTGLSYVAEALLEQKVKRNKLKTFES